MQNDSEKQTRDPRFTDYLTSHPPSRKRTGLLLQVSMMVLVFVMMAVALVVVSWILT